MRAHVRGTGEPHRNDEDKPEEGHAVKVGDPLDQDHSEAHDIKNSGTHLSNPKPQRIVK